MYSFVPNCSGEERQKNGLDRKLPRFLKMSGEGVFLGHLLIVIKRP